MSAIHNKAAKPDRQDTTTLRSFIRLGLVIEAAIR